MPQSEKLLLNYLELARASQLRRQLLVCDKLLVLAGVAAEQLDWDEIAAGCRQRILQHNPRHLVRRWSHFAAAAEAERFQIYCKQLRRKYSPEKTEHMLESLGVSAAAEDASPPADRDRAALLLAAIAAEATPQATTAAGRATAPPAKARAPGLPGAPSGDRAAQPARWWPFWLGLAVWTALALVLLCRAWVG